MLGKIFTKSFHPGQSLIDLRNTEDIQNNNLNDAISLTLFTQRQEHHIIRFGYSDKQSSLWLHEAAEKIETFLAAHPHLQEIVLICKDGRWLSRFAWDIARLHRNCLIFENGMKGLRKWIKKMLSEPRPYVMLTGPTGSGKTEVLRICKQRRVFPCVDFELLANHAGSVFGNVENKAQPTQIAFEFSIAKILAGITPGIPVLMEHEPGNLGALHVPLAMMQQFDKAIIVALQRSMDKRIECLVKQYAAKNDSSILAGIHKIASNIGETVAEVIIKNLYEKQYALVAEKLLHYYDEREQYQVPGTPQLVINSDIPEKAADVLLRFIQKKTPPTR